MREDLKRDLGFWGALTIGAGTMIGAGIFLLAGVALELTGPAAVLSYLIAGVICLMTAAKPRNWPPACRHPAATTTSSHARWVPPSGRSPVWGSG